MRHMPRGITQPFHDNGKSTTKVAIPLGNFVYLLSKDICPATDARYMIVKHRRPLTKSQNPVF
jgi:hypothetical protein